MLSLGAMSGAMVMAGKPSFAATYPIQPITFFIPDGIGGGSWTYVREFSMLLGQYFNPPVNVEPLSDPGANGQKAALDLAHAAPDGYTIGMLGDVMGVRSDEGLLKQLTWISTLGRANFALAVGPNSNLKTVADLQKLSQKRPVVFSSSGKTALNYFATTLFCAANNIRAKMVTGYKGSTDAMLAVTRGDVDATAQSLPTLNPMQKNGLLRTIFVYSDQSPIEGVECSSSIGKPELSKVIQWRFVAGPPGLPQPIVTTLASAFQTLIEKPDTISWAQKVEIPLYYLNPEQTADAANTQLALVNKWQGAA